MTESATSPSAVATRQTHRPTAAVSLLAAPTKGLAAQLSASEMAFVATSSDPSLRAELGARPDCTLTVLAGLVYDHSPAVRVAVAGNPRMMSALSDVLEKDKQAEVLIALAQNPHTPGDVLQRLSRHKNPAVKAAALEGIARS